MSAPTLFVISFLGLIALGTLGLLVLPGLFVGPRLGMIDALFTMTSAVCVTGLVVVDTATRFTPAGQAWILLFIQLGGIGLITLTSLIIALVGRRLTFRSELIAVPTLHGAHGRQLRDLTLAVTRFTFAIEAVGAVLLWLQWSPHLGAGEAVWHAIFHAVSATCNAGFSTFSDSLAGFAERPFTLLTISLLVIVGGFGFLSTEELIRWWRRGHRRAGVRLSTHTYAAVATTLVLLASGTFLFALFEWNGTLRPFSLVDKLANAWFLSVTPRTAGFNAVGYAEIGNIAAFLTVILMFIGGSPGGMAGGIKTTSLAILVGLAVSRVRGRRYVQLNDRAVPEGTVQRTVSLTLVAGVYVTACLFVLSYTETGAAAAAEARQAFLPLLFEAVSAFGTVGLSMDVTPHLSGAGKLVLVLLMFVGRVGPMSFVAAIALRGRVVPASYRPALEDVIVG